MEERIIKVEEMISYLQFKLDRFQKMAEKYGMDDEEVNRLFDEMLACKEMAECLIGMPVNLQQDGKVTVGF